MIEMLDTIVFYGDLSAINAVEFQMIEYNLCQKYTEIEIMKLVGATDWFIRWPFLIEGALIGLVGSVIPSVLLWIGYSSVYQNLSRLFQGTSFSLLPTTPYMYYLTALMLVMGIVIGSIGSAMSIRRFLRI